jgi:hypothetical protein
MYHGKTSMGFQRNQNLHGVSLVFRLSSDVSDPAIGGQLAKFLKRILVDQSVISRGVLSGGFLTR